LKVVVSLCVFRAISLATYDVYSASTCDLCFRGYRIAWVDPILGPTTKWIPGKLGGSRIYVNVVKDTGAPQKWMEKVKNIRLESSVAGV
jgi:hypothetical protein